MQLRVSHGCITDPSTTSVEVIDSCDSKETVGQPTSVEVLNSSDSE